MMKNDNITLKMAIEEPIWQLILITESKRKISVEMTYADLYIITKVIEEHREKKIGEEDETTTNLYK